MKILEVNLECVAEILIKDKNIRYLLIFMNCIERNIQKFDTDKYKKNIRYLLIFISNINKCDSWTSRTLSRIRYYIYLSNFYIINIFIFNNLIKDSFEFIEIKRI